MIWLLKNQQNYHQKNKGFTHIFYEIFYEIGDKVSVDFFKKSSDVTVETQVKNGVVRSVCIYRGFWGVRGGFALIHFMGFPTAISSRVGLARDSEIEYYNNRRKEKSHKNNITLIIDSSTLRALGDCWTNQRSNVIYDL